MGKLQCEIDKIEEELLAAVTPYMNKPMACSSAIIETDEHGNQHRVHPGFYQGVACLLKESRYPVLNPRSLQQELEYDMAREARRRK